MRPFNPDDFCQRLADSGPQLTTGIKGDWVGTLVRTDVRGDWVRVLWCSASSQTVGSDISIRRRGFP